MFALAILPAQTGSMPVAASTAQDVRVHAKLIQGPSEADVKSLYPATAEKMSVGGKTVISCIVTIEGRLDRCTVASETPIGYGFGEAALKLAVRFSMTPATLNGDLIEEKVNIPLIWSLQPSKVSPPLHGEVRLRCTATVDGALAACQVQSESPTGHGLGLAALKMAETIKMRPKLLDGRPVESTVILPIKFQLEDEQSHAAPITSPKN